MEENKALAELRHLASMFHQLADDMRRGASETMDEGFSDRLEQRAEAFQQALEIVQSALRNATQ